ncbi:MAG: GNAT family N-acetyltransferase [Verrucomicrobia bacterium]|nr:GNAT family N-acetyltransferase [Verrucomicrobiota bacterium]
MRIETARLILRPFHPADLDRMTELFADPLFMRFSLGPKTPAESRALLERWVAAPNENAFAPFAVIERASDQLIGYCGFLPQEIDGVNEIEIGYRLDSRFWNRGYASEAAQAVRDHAFGDLQLDRVISLIIRRITPRDGWRRKMACTSRKRQRFEVSRR